MSNINLTEKLLIITSSIELQNELKISLQFYNLTVVKDAEQALEILKYDNSFSALLVGIFKEATHGFDLLNTLKVDHSIYSGPVLVITDSITDEVIDKMKDYNIFDYVVRYSSDAIIRTRIRNAVIYYAEKRKLLEYAVEQVYQNLNDTKMLITLLAQIVEFKNTESGKHTENISIITRILCKKLTELHPNKYLLSDRDIEYIVLASALHDIGKVYIPSYILNKPSKLDPEEFDIMKTHTALGAGIIDRLLKYKDRPVIKYAHDICLSHHERWDGNGYPNKLKGDEVPIWAQIVALADCYDALTSDRVYRPAILHGAALSMIDQGDCGIFNPDLIDCMWECQEQLDAVKKNQLYQNNLTKDEICAIVEELCKIK